MATIASSAVTSSNDDLKTLGITAAPDALWAVSTDTGRVFRSDPATLIPDRQMTLGTGLNDVTIGGGSVWVTNEVSGTLIQIDPNNLSIIRTIPLGKAPTAVAFVDGKVWVTIQDPHTATNQL